MSLNQEINQVLKISMSLNQEINQKFNIVCSKLINIRLSKTQHQKL